MEADAWWHLIQCLHDASILEGDVHADERTLTCQVEIGFLGRVCSNWRIKIRNITYVHTCTPPEYFDTPFPICLVKG
jgi:hypothetical protein